MTTIPRISRAPMPRTSSSSALYVNVSPGPPGPSIKCGIWRPEYTSDAMMSNDAFCSSMGFWAFVSADCRCGDVSNSGFPSDVRILLWRCANCGRVGNDARDDPSARRSSLICTTMFGKEPAAPSSEIWGRAKPTFHADPHGEQYGRMGAHIRHIALGFARAAASGNVM